VADVVGVGVGLASGVAVGVWLVGVGEAVGVGVGVAVGVGLGVADGLGEGVGVAGVTSNGAENSLVLPLPSVAVAVTFGPDTLPVKDQLPLPSAVVEPS
jgi:hypothetical protein